MNSFAPILIALPAATVFGLWYKSNNGRVKSGKKHGMVLSEKELRQPLGQRVTLLQFSSAFCSPCRATKTLIKSVVENMNDVVHVEMDAESNLDLVNKLAVKSTPTTIILNRRGQEVGRAVGAPTREQVLSAISAVK